MRRSTMSPRIPTLVKRYFVSAVVVARVVGAVRTACSSKERAPDTARAGASGAGAVPPAPANSVAATPPTTAALPGTLTKPIDQYTGDEFYDFVQKLKWGGGVE